MFISLLPYSERLMSMYARHGRWMWYQRKVGRKNWNNGFGLHSNNSCIILQICVWVYGVMDTMFPPLLILCIFDFYIFRKQILNRKELLILPWVLEPLSSFISGPSLSWLICLPHFYIFLQLLCSLFMIVFFLLYLSHSLLTLLSDFLKTLTLHFCYFLLRWNYDIPVRQICCTVYIYAYYRRLKGYDMIN